MSPGPLITIECPKCHADRTTLDTSFGLPGYVQPSSPGGGDCINPACALRVRIMLCPRCHYLEMYHDVS